VKPAPLLVVLNALGNADCRPRRSGAGYSARCPAHDDSRPSLSVSESSDGRVLIHCQAGCAIEDVLGALKLTASDLFPTEATRSGAEIVATYDYLDEDGEFLFQVVRYASKAFKQRRPDGSAGWLWNLKGVPRVLYRLPEALEAVADGRTIFVAEGEKDVEALRAAGEVATTCPMGAGKWRTEHASALHGAAEVVIVADADDPGRAHARQVADSLDGHVGHLLIVEAVTGKDAADHLGAGRTVDEFSVTYDSIETAPEGDCSTGGLLDELAIVLRRFVVWSTDTQVDFVALWIAHTYVFGLFDTTPYLDVTSAAKRSGKTRLLEVLSMLVARPWPIVEASEAVLFRKVDRERPTLLVDEIDATFGKDSKVTEGLRAIYNSGYRSGAKVPRCVGQSFEPTDFEVYCPKAFAGLAGLPDTVKDRSGRIQLRRRARTEAKPERMRLSRVRAELEPLAARLRRWSTVVEDELRDTDPLLPDDLTDRAQDGCEVLAAIADLAGGDWPDRSRAAFVEIMGAEEDTDLGVLLLGHLRDAFDKAGITALDGAVRATTEKLLEVVVARGDESPWGAWWGKDLDAGNLRRPAMRLAGMLRPYGIKPKDLRVGGSVSKGYDRADFADAWERYVPV
jgi:hypothetical protein